MTNRAYIVVNEEQEQEVLVKLERGGAEWGRSKSKPTDFIPSYVEHTTKLPYALLVENNQISWCDIEALYEFDDIVYDGRKEEKMADKYVVSQKFMNELKGWKHGLILEDAFFVNQEAINNMPKIIKNWWVDDYVTIGESNKRLISIIRYMSGANDFEVEKPKKWVVRSKERNEQGNHLYTYLIDSNGVKDFMTGWTKDIATKFDTKEEAESWANAHQEVIEVEE